MEFKLKDLVDMRKHDIVGHLFLHCIDSDFANAHKFISDEDFNNRTIDITLTIDGQEFDILPWLEQFKEDYFTYVKRAAQNIVSEKLSNRIEEIAETLNTLKEKIENAESNINWDEVLINE